MEAIRATGLKLAVDPLGGAAVHYWEPINAIYKLGVAIPVRMALNVFLQKHRQGDVLALQFAMYGRPVRLLMAPGTLFRAAIGEKPLFQNGVGQIGGERPGNPRRLAPTQREPHRRRRYADPPRDLARRNPGVFQSQAIAQTAHGHPSIGIGVSPRQSRKSGP